MTNVRGSKAGFGGLRAVVTFPPPATAPQVAAAWAEGQWIYRWQHTGAVDREETTKNSAYGIYGNARLFFCSL